MPTPTEMMVEHEMAMTAVGLSYHLLALHRETFARLLAANARMESFGHIVDPTLYRRMLHSESYKAQIELIGHVQTFLAAVDRIIPNLPEVARAASDPDTPAPPPPDGP